MEERSDFPRGSPVGAGQANNMRLNAITAVVTVSCDGTVAAARPLDR